MRLDRLAAAAIVLAIQTAALAQTTTRPTAAAPAQASPSRQTTEEGSPAAATTTAPLRELDSEQMREDFRSLLSRYPPEVGKVLKLDPTLLSNQAYLASYPELATYLAQHPEIAHSPRYYLEGVYIPSDPIPQTPGQRMWEHTMEGFMIVFAFTFAAVVLSWLIRTVIEHRRWSRVYRNQTEVHNKLLDRFSTNDELMAYIQTPAGKRFLESAPIVVETAPAKAYTAPVSRILWSMQAGLVLAAAGVGFQFVSGSVEKEVSQPFFALGVVGLAVGVGFVLSAVTSFAISRRLGLLEPPPDTLAG